MNQYYIVTAAQEYVAERYVVKFFQAHGKWYVEYTDGAESCTTELPRGGIPIVPLGDVCIRIALAQGEP